MAKLDIDPVLQQLAQAINDSGQAAAPVTVLVHGTVLTGALIAEQRYFSERGRPRSSCWPDRAVNRAGGCGPGAWEEPHDYQHFQRLAGC